MEEGKFPSKSQDFDFAHEVFKNHPIEDVLVAVGHSHRILFPGRVVLVHKLFERYPGLDQSVKSRFFFFCEREGKSARAEYDYPVDGIALSSHFFDDSIRSAVKAYLIACEIERRKMFKAPVDSQKAYSYRICVGAAGAVGCTPCLERVSCYLRGAYDEAALEWDVIADSEKLKLFTARLKKNGPALCVVCAAEKSDKDRMELM